MKQNHALKLFLVFLFICFFSSSGFCASSFDRELIVQDKTRAMQVEKVFKEMMAAYEDEYARGFLDYVSDERFRQDYITFTDALYSDFRNYEIHQVEYWIDKTVPDNIKQFLFVHWEKRYENLDDGRQLTQKGVSRFLFDEVEGEYLLVELAGNNLFGASLQEWVEEVPFISGQVATSSNNDSMTGQVATSSNNDSMTDSPKLPDLTIISASWVPNYTGSFEGELSFTVRNIGTDVSDTCQLTAEQSTAPSSVGIGFNIPSLNPGETYSDSRGSLPELSSLEVDSFSAVAESNEDNNNFSF
jgi:subtilase family serine protease